MRVWRLLVTPVMLSAVAAAQSPATAPAPLAPQVERCLRYVPDDARLVLIIPSVDELVRGIAAFGKVVGVPELAELTAREFFEETLGKNGAALDPAGALVVALCAECDEPLVLGMPGVGASWASATQPVFLRDDVQLFEFGPDRYVAACTGSTAILARDRAELRRALEAGGKLAARLGPEVGELLARRQIVCYVDPGSWRDAIDTQLAALGQLMTMGMAAAGPDAEAAVQVWAWLFERAKRLVAETQGGVASAQVNGQGLRLAVRVQFKPEGEAARYLKQIGRCKRDLLRGLPGGEVAIICAYEWEEGPDVEGFNAAFTRALLRMESRKEKVGAERMETLIERSLQLNRKVPGSNLLITFNSPEQGLLYCGLYFSLDAPGVQREIRAVCESTPELLNAWGGLPSTQLTRQDEQIAGVDADVYLFRFASGDAGSQAAIEPMIRAMYGADPALAMAPHAEGVAFAFGPRARAREKLAELLRTTGPPLSHDARVAEALRRLPADPQAVLLLDLPRTLKSVWGVVEQLGLPLPELALDPGPAPLVVGAMYLDAAAVRGELYVPAEAVRAVVKPLEQFQDEADKAY